jgi:hypothetical protein
MLFGTAQAPVTDSSATVWSSYVREAGVFDKSMVEGWKVRMDGIVIFVRAFTGVEYPRCLLSSLGGPLLSRRNCIHH